MKIRFPSVLLFSCIVVASCSPYVVKMETHKGPLQEGVTYEITPPPECPYPPIRLKFPDDFPPYTGWEDEKGVYHKGLREGNKNALKEYEAVK